MDSFLFFPYISTVPNKTEAFLTAEFEMGSGEPGSYDRPKLRTGKSFINVSYSYNQIFKEPKLPVSYEKIYYNS